MPTLTSYIPGYDATIKKTANVRSEPKLTATILRVVGTPETWDVTGWVKGDVDPDGGSDQWITRWNAGKWEYTAKSNVSAGPTAPTGTPTDCTAAVKAATDPLHAQIATQTATITSLTSDVAAANARADGATTAERDRIATAEAARIRAT